MYFRKARDPEDRRRRRKISVEEFLQWHIDHYQKGKSLQWIANQYGINRQELSIRFKQLGLPVAAKVEQRAYRPPDDSL